MSLERFNVKTTTESEIEECINIYEYTDTRPSFWPITRATHFDQFLACTKPTASSTAVTVTLTLLYYVVLMQP